MRLRSKTILIFCLTFLCMGLIVITASNLITLKGFTNLEEQDIEVNVQRTVSALSDEITDLDILVWDWASWDDTYDYILDINMEYVESNIVNGTFIDLQLNLIIYIDSNNEIVYSKAFDLQDEREIPVPRSLMEHLHKDSLLTRHLEPESNISGIVLLPEDPLIVASRPILTSEDEGPIRGTLIMGQYLDSSKIEQLAETTHLSLTHYRFDDPSKPQDVQEELSSLSEEGQITTRLLDKKTIAGYTLLKDVYGNPALVFSVDKPRDIFKQGQNSVFHSILSLSASFLFISVVTLLFLERFILSRLASLSTVVNKIGNTSDFSFRVSMEGNDEISSLGSNVNWMLSELERSQVELVRYTNQLEEMVEEKSQELLEAEQMITAGRVSAMIGHDLRSPLQTISNAIYLLKSNPEKDENSLEMIEGSVQRAVQMLEEFRHKTRDSPLKVVVADLRVLMRAAVEEVHISDSVNVVLKLGDGVEEIPLDSLKIRRVLDNLIGNAVDAMPDGGTLTVAALRAENKVIIEISDTGIGIPDEEISDLFKPFHTTKTKGLGLGLAYCKRAVKAHGGTITVESEVGEGTTFIVTLHMKNIGVET